MGAGAYVRCTVQYTCGHFTPNTKRGAIRHTFTLYTLCAIAYGTTVPFIRDFFWTLLGQCQCTYAAFTLRFYSNNGASEVGSTGAVTTVMRTITRHPPLASQPSASALQDRARQLCG